MKIGIMGWDYEEFESLSLMRAGQVLEHEMFLFALQDVQVTVVGDDLTVRANGCNLRDLDVIVSRAQIRMDNWREDEEMYRALEEAELPLLDPASIFIPAKSKLLTMQKLAKAGFTVPDTFQCKTLEEVKCVWKEYKQIVVKPSYGYAGHDIERIMDDFEAQGKTVETLLARYGSLLVQQYIPHPDGDIRATVVGQEVVFGLRRIPNEKTWKANVALGADFQIFTPDEETCELSLMAAQTMGIQIAGLDILKHQGKSYILEVNNVPGWYCFEEEEALEISKFVIRYAEKWVDQTVLNRLR